MSTVLGLQTGDSAWLWLFSALLVSALPIVGLVVGIDTNNAPDGALSGFESGSGA